MDMSLTATASRTVRNKNLILIGMIVVFAIWFAYDGWSGWPSKNDEIVTRQIPARISQNKLTADAADDFKDWKGWNQETPERRKLLEKSSHENHFEGFHGEMDILIQKLIVIGLALGALVAIWWYAHCQKRRAIADDAGLSPEAGVLIPWDAITRVDNTRWKRSGIVDVTYMLNGEEKITKLDDYLLDNLPPVLNEVAVRATKAQVIMPAEDAAKTSTPDDKQQSLT